MAAAGVLCRVFARIEGTMPYPELVIDWRQHAQLADNIWYAQMAGWPRVLAMKPLRTPGTDTPFVAYGSIPDDAVC